MSKEWSDTMSEKSVESGAQCAGSQLDALRKLVDAREGLATASNQAIAASSVLAEHVKTLDQYVQSLGQSRQRLRAGGGMPSETRLELDRLWRAARSPQAFESVAAWHASTGAHRNSPGLDWLQTVFPQQTGPLRQWQTTTGLLGTTALRPMPGGDGGDDPLPRDGGDPPPAPLPPPDPSPHSPPPMRICTVAPYEVAFPDAGTSGIAVLETNPIATRSDGSISVQSMTAAPVLAGGGTDSRALLGSTVKWPEGYGMMTLSATIRLDGASLYAITILGGATASAELLMTADLSIGGGQRVGTTPLGAAVAPLLWHTDLDLRGTYTVSIPGIVLNGLAGEAQVVAGVHDNTAAVGVVGSSGASTLLVGQLLQICVDLY
jgi:hypothetical protein